MNIDELDNHELRVMVEALEIELEESEEKQNRYFKMYGDVLSKIDGYKQSRGMFQYIAAAFTIVYFCEKYFN